MYAREGIMRSVSIRDVRIHLADLLTEVGSGQTVAITRRGQEVARLVPTDRAASALPSRAEKRRAMLKKAGKPSRSMVVRMRGEERA
jgi:prevent-host-death family protein